MNVFVKYVWQRYVMEVGHLTNFISNIIVPNSQHFTYYQLNKGLPSAGQIAWLHHFKSLVQVFFSALKNSFNYGTYQRTNIPIPIYFCNRPISTNNIGKPIYWSGPNDGKQFCMLKMEEILHIILYVYTYILHNAHNVTRCQILHM